MQYSMAELVDRGWRNAALCREVDPGLFFGPDKERERDRTARTADAMAVCGRCPVSGDCLADALSTKEKFGVRGGVDLEEAERERLSARRAEKAGAGK